MDQVDEAADLRMAAALDYVRKGLAVVPLHSPTWSEGEWRCTCGVWPCESKGKHPRKGFGLLHPCSTEQEVNETWERYPETNVAVVVPPGFFVVDLDSNQAIEWWEARVGDEGEETRMTLTGSGEGQHRWYRLPEGRRVKNGPLIRWGPHSEVKITTPGQGIVAMPPSLHGSGGTYAWRNGVRVSSFASESLLALVAPAHGNEAATASSGWHIQQAVGKVSGEGRDTLMLQWLGKLRRDGLGENALLAAAWEMEEAFGEPLGNDKVRQHVAFVLGKPGGGETLPNLILAARMGGDGNGNGSTSDGDGRPYKLQRIESDPKVWLLHWGSGQLTRLSTPQIQAWGSVQSQYLEQHRGAPPWNPGGGRGANSDPWLGADGLLQWLLDHMEDEDFIEPSPEETLAGRIAALCRKRFQPGARETLRGIQALREDTGWWVDEENEVVEFRLLALVNQEHSASNRKPMETSQLAKGVREMGGRTGVVRWIPATQNERGDTMKGTTVRVALLPLSAVPDLPLA